jgi:hypothetical protein
MLTRLSTITSRLKFEAGDTADNTLLTNMIKHASGRFTKECNRIFDRGAGVTFEFRADEMNVRPDRYPIEAVTGFELKTTEAEGWVAVTSAPDYLIGPAKNIIEMASPIGSSRELGRLTYSGGYVLPGTTPDTGQTALPDEIEQSCVEQVCYWYANRNRLGLTSVSAEGGSVQNFGKLDLLPHVLAVLKKYERWAL